MLFPAIIFYILLKKGLKFIFNLRLWIFIIAFMLSITLFILMQNTQTELIDFIQKPFRDQELLDRVRDALSTDEQRREERDRHAEVESRLQRLTKREREVFDLVVTGKPNKVIAYELDVSQRTVEIHRARVMEKMEARSLADLVRMHISL